MARRADLHPKAAYICADLSPRPQLFPCSRAADHTFFWCVRCLRYMLAQRVCCRDPLPRRLDRICGRGPKLAMGQESTPLKRRVADFGKESVRPKGGGCFERGTLNADRKANWKG